MKFYQWLITTPNLPKVVNDLADSVKQDDDCPCDSSDLQQWIRHLDFCGADFAAYDALESAFELYKETS